MARPVKFVLSGIVGERRRFVEAFEEFCQTNLVSDAVRQAADLALEEHLTNVLGYGFDPGVTKHASVELDVIDNCLHVEVADTGKPFNPLDAPPVDTSLPLDEKPIGGLGVHLMRQFMDELSYTRADGRNILRMTKRFAAG